MVSVIQAATTKTTQPPVSSKSFPRTPLPDTLVTTYLQMTTPTQFRPAYLNYPDGIKVMCMDIPDVAFYRFLYTTVGKPWRWRDRLSYTDEEIESMLLAPGTSIHVLYVDGAPAGYIELVKRKEGPSGRFYSTQIVYFGLRESYLGRGLGKHLLSHGIAYAWNKGTQRLWVYTCNLDSPYALDNCIKRGFKIYRIEKEPMPESYV
ncbi:MAG TPA: N-acetyltransferase [Cyanobacteria bacterium UBA11162]|nr:N-acetyltransferase [Cyanobacteria bacterium UBA11162]